MNKQKIQQILEEHKKWYNNEGGQRADLRDVDLRGADLQDVGLQGAGLRCADLRCADLRCVDLRGADLRCADLRDVDLRGADLQDVDLRCVDLRGADLQDVDLRCADLRCADLRGVDLRCVDLRCADLRDVDLRGADLQDVNIDYKTKRKIVSNRILMNKMFNRNKKGWVAYKTFNSQYNSPKKWQIKKGFKIKEKLDTNRFVECGFGINVATRKWIEENKKGQEIWELEIPFTAEICVPYQTDGKVRVSEAKLIKIIDN